MLTYSCLSEGVGSGSTASAPSATSRHPAASRLRALTLVASLALGSWLVARAVLAADAAMPIARLALSEGALDVIREGKPVALRPELPLLSGDTVRTHDGKATLRFEDMTEIRVSPNTTLSVTEGMDKRDVNVFLGRLGAAVAAQ